jgi:hypothetical protein
MMYNFELGQKYIYNHIFGLFVKKEKKCHCCIYCCIYHPSFIYILSRPKIVFILGC